MALKIKLWLCLQLVLIICSAPYVYGANSEPLQKEKVELILKTSRLFFISNRPLTSLTEYQLILEKQLDGVEPAAKGVYIDDKKRVTVSQLTETEYDIMILEGDNLELRQALHLENYKSIHITFSTNNYNQITFITIRFGRTQERLRFTNYIIYNGETNKYDYQYCSSKSEECTSVFIGKLHDR